MKSLKDIAPVWYAAFAALLCASFAAADSSYQDKSYTGEAACLILAF